MEWLSKNAKMLIGGVGCLLVLLLIAVIVLTVIYLIAFKVAGAVSGDGGDRGTVVSKEWPQGTLVDGWTRKEIPAGEACGPYPVGQDVVLLVRPQDQDDLAYTVDFYGNQLDVNGLPFTGADRRAIVIKFVLFRSKEPEGIGTTYKWICNPVR